MKNQVNAIGFCAAIMAVLAIIAFGIVQGMQVYGSLDYPIADKWIYGTSLGIVPGYLVAIAALHVSIDTDKKIFSMISLLFAIIYSVFAILVYGVQLGSVLPFVNGDSDEGVLILSPHSLFWTIDALGYISMGLSTFFASFVFDFKGPDRWLKIGLIANTLTLPLIIHVYFNPAFSNALLWIASPWLLTTTGSMVLLARYFSRFRHPQVIVD